MSKVSEILAWEVVPARHAKYVYMMAGAIVGGVVFAFSASWFAAVQWDLTTVFICWAVFKIADPCIAAIANVFRFLLR